ncbi:MULTISPECIES: vWA domain-containing protein [Roseomonadaceae]|uniref:VWA domain-containing protein n=1 Tax=Falsiroseomonas oleicola TaxID=2801474 RepID=A0ABS6HH51_9PROT|nr:VWA domain-containing protein [Roseomonas oleicola]MBU8547062.1 VWA domain-containing protein [Roseomonas oleicola]
MKARFALALLAAPLLLAARPVAAERVSVLVFDASGSMWNRLEGNRTRIEVAREVVGDYFTRRDAAVPLSVIAYGHNRRGDCRDIEVVAPMGRAPGAALSDRLRRLVPRGMTPLTESLRQGRAQIPDTAESADIILVTDGLETCEGDPCALAAEFAAEGIAIRAHVVGFGLTRTEVQALSCITEQTGGKLFETNSGAELAEALREVSLPTPATPPPAPPPAPAREAAFDIQDKAEAGFTYRIRWRGEARFVDYMGFVPRGAARGVVGPSYGVIGGADRRPNNPVGRQAPTQIGEYDLIIRAANGAVIARQAVEVVAPNMGFEPVGSVAPGSRVVFQFRAPNRLEERVVIARPGDPPNQYGDDWAFALASNGRRQLRVPTEPGEYEVRYINARRTEVMFARRFGVGVPFEDADTTSVAALAAQAATATRAAPGQDAMPEVEVTFNLPEGVPPGPVTWSAVPLDPDLPPEAWAPQAPSAQGRGRFLPGRYRVTAIAPGEVTFEAEVTIAPGAPASFTIPVVPVAEERHGSTLTGPWQVFLITPPAVPQSPVPMLGLQLARQTPDGPVTGNWTARPSLLGVQRAGETGPVQSGSLAADGLLRLSFSPAAPPGGEFLLSVRPYGIGYAGSLSVGGQGVRVALWPADHDLPELGPLRAALHGAGP